MTLVVVKMMPTDKNWGSISERKEKIGNPKQHIWKHPKITIINIKLIIPDISWTQDRGNGIKEMVVNSDPFKYKTKTIQLWKFCK